MASKHTNLHWCRRYAYESMVEQNFVSAGRWCVKALVEHGFQAEDCGNLAFVAFSRCSRASVLLFYEMLSAAGIHQVKGPSATFLRLSFEIYLGGNESDKFVRNDYINRILSPRIKNTPSIPILFWHVPKCSGTSLNEAFSTHFYGTQLADVWPGYNYKPLVSYVIENMLAEIPYASSVHLGTDDLSSRTPHFAFTSLRQPAQRCFSMFRQEMAANRFLRKNEKEWHNYRALPRYGEFWDYRNDIDFHSWLEHIPPRLLGRQLTTFSSREHVNEAVNRIRALDYYFVRDLHVGSEAELFDKLGLEYTSETVPTTLNRSDKSIILPDNAEALVRARLRNEYRMINALTESP